MPKEGLTEYNLLISCPSDVDQFVVYIKDCVDKFNSIHVEIFDAIIRTRYWKIDSYAQSGGKPQDLLNKQVVEDCDAVVAIFWTRFGTPTDKYGSGTEEEIENMLASGKQVFLYFLDKEINLSKVDWEQYEKVKEFKDKYQDKGIFESFEDENSLKEKFYHDLEKHFLPIFKSTKLGYIQKSRGSLIGLEDYISGSDKYFSVNQYNFNDLDAMKDMKGDIISELNRLNVFILSQKDAQEDKETPIQPMSLNDPTLKEHINKLLDAGYSIPGVSSDVIIDDATKAIINQFAFNEGISLEDQFWNLGNLKERQNLSSILDDHNNKILVGTDEEKDRYRTITKLALTIKKYNEYFNYFSNIEKQFFVNLVVSNTGSSFDEDIDIKLIINRGCLIKKEDFPIPEKDIIEEIINADYLETFYEIQEDDIVEEYSEYPLQITNVGFENLILNDKLRDQREYENYKEQYLRECERIFCYKYNKKEESEILMFNISYLKQNTKMAFPSALVFNEIPEYIDYEIRSKYNADVVSGRIKFFSSSKVV